MNDKLQYELLITEKLASVPVPDMADAIWRRIEAQLDLDMPTDDGGGDAPAPQSPAGGSNLWGNISVFIAVIAFITFFIINKNNKEDQLQPVISLPATEVIPADSVPPDLSPPDNSNITKPVLQQGNSNAMPPLLQTPDAALAVPALTPAPDSLTKEKEIITQVPAPVSAPVKDSVATKKKTRGVPLNDADYRIVPKKDSLP